METNLIVEGFKFMGLGMGTVFLFLIILIVSMQALAIVVDRFFPEPQTVDTVPEKKDNKKIIAAITAAIKHHREG